MTTIKQLFAQKPANDVKDVTITGWVRTLRQSKTFAFMEVNDGTFFQQPAGRDGARTRFDRSDEASR